MHPTFAHVHDDVHVLIILIRLIEAHYVGVRRWAAELLQDAHLQGAGGQAVDQKSGMLPQIYVLCVEVLANHVPKTVLASSRLPAHLAPSAW